MRLTQLVVAALLVTRVAQSQTLPPPIIDMHLHASSVAAFAGLAGGKFPVPHCVPMTDYPVPESGQKWPEVFSNPGDACRKTMSATSDTGLMRQTLAIMERRNIIG